MGGSGGRSVEKTTHERRAEENPVGGELIYDKIPFVVGVLYTQV